MQSKVVLLALALSALQLQSQTPKALWVVDLSRYGYQGRPPAAVAHNPADSQYDFQWANQQGVAFIDPNVVAAYFVVYDAPAGVSEPREPKITDSFRLVTVFLNASNGELIKQLDWTLQHDSFQIRPSFFYPAAQGRFIVILGDTVSLYSSDFKALTQFEAHGELTPVASPSGESLLLKTFSRPTVHYDLLDSGKLSVLKSWDQAAGDSPSQLDSLWGDRFAWTKPSGLYVAAAASESKRLLVARPESCDTLQSGNSRLLPGHMCDVQENLLAVSGQFCGGFQFVDEKSLVGNVCSGDNKLITVSSDGKITSEYNLGLEQTDGPVIPSANGKRYTIPTTRWGLGKNNVPDKQTARVFDLGSENPLLTVNVPSSPDSSHGFYFNNYGDTRYGWGGLALSPEGKLLAVKSGAIVRIYSVPEKVAASQCTSNCNDRAALSTHPPPHQHPVPSPASPLFKRMLAWLPANTETLVAAAGPLQMPKMTRDANGDLSLDNSPEVVRDTFRQFFLLLLLRLEKEFKDAPIAAAIEGSSTFRPPNGLGMASYQGVAIAVFKDDITARAAAFISDSASTAVRSEQIDGQSVQVFQDKSEGNIQTTYVAFRRPDVVVVATDESYLRETLARIGGKRGERALPDTLPEWKHVDTTAAFWAVRHYPKTEAAKSGLLPEACRVGHSTDEKPIGLTFSFSPGASSLATINYLSGDESYLRCIQSNLFRHNERGVAEMRMQYSEAQSGVMEGSYNLSELESAQYFSFVLEALLGHSIFV